MGRYVAWLRDVVKRKMRNVAEAVPFSDGARTVSIGVGLAGGDRPAHARALVAHAATNEPRAWAGLFEVGQAHDSSEREPRDHCSSLVVSLSHRRRKIC